MFTPYARPIVNRFGPAELKRSYVRRSAIWLAATAACVIVPIGLSPVLPRESRDAMMFVLLGAPVAWFVGLGYYAKSKGHSGIFGLLGFFNVLGLFILVVLPDQWKQALEHEAAISRQPTIPPDRHPQPEAGTAAYPAWWNG